jgi:hypothetical protein
MDTDTMDHSPLVDTLFRNARSHNGWQDKPVSDLQLRALYEAMTSTRR